MPPVATFGPLLALLASCAFFASQTDRFLTGQNFSLILQQVMVVGVMAIGQTLVILTAGIDLSCGMVMALGSIVMTKFAVDLGMNPYVAIALRTTRVHRVWTPERRADHLRAAAAVYRHTRNPEHRLRDHPDLLGVPDVSGLPAALLFFGTTFRIGHTAVTYGTVLMLGMYLAAWFLLRETSPGRHIYASATMRRPHA
jgi:fructose transport system permease protein